MAFRRVCFYFCFVTSRVVNFNRGILQARDFPTTWDSPCCGVVKRGTVTYMWISLISQVREKVSGVWWIRSGKSLQIDTSCTIWSEFYKFVKVWSGYFSEAISLTSATISPSGVVWPWDVRRDPNGRSGKILWRRTCLWTCLRALFNLVNDLRFSPQLFNALELIRNKYRSKKKMDNIFGVING